MADWEKVYKAALAERQRIGELKNGLLHFEEFKSWHCVTAKDLATAIDDLHWTTDEIAAFIIKLREAVKDYYYEMGRVDGLGDEFGREEVRECLHFEAWDSNWCGDEEDENG